MKLQKILFDTRSEGGVISALDLKLSVVTYIENSYYETVYEHAHLWIFANSTRNTLTEIPYRYYAR